MSDEKKSGEFSVKCPDCGSADIRERNVAYAEIEVTGWDYEDGNLTPAAYDTNIDNPYWLTSDDYPYVCKECEWQGDLDDLLVVPIVPPDAAEVKPS